MIRKKGIMEDKNIIKVGVGFGSGIRYLLVMCNFLLGILSRGIINDRILGRREREIEQEPEEELNPRNRKRM